MPRRLTSRLLVFALVASLCQAQGGKKRKKKADEEPITQTLEILKDPPAAVVADVSRLAFHTAPMASRGLLSQQVRDGLKALFRLAGRAQIVKLRAFVAGSGDMRRVQSIVSEEFTEKRLPLPAVTVIQVGALPHDGAHVLIESVAVERNAVNPHGLAFVSGQQVVREEPLIEVAPLARESVARLRKASDALKAAPADVVRVSCFLSSIGDIHAVRQAVAAEFPRAATSYVQLLRGLGRGLVECEAVARLSAPPASPLEFVNPEGLPQSPAYSQVALVGPGKVVITGSQLAFHSQEEDVRLAFQRLKNTVEQAGGSIGKVAMSNFYPLSQPIAEKIRAVRFDFYDKAKPPASTLVVFEGLPSMDASFAVEVVAVI